MESAGPVVLGVDFGRVIQGGDTPDSTSGDTQFLGATFHEALQSPPTAGVFDVLPGLVDRFDGRVWIISRCGHRVREVMLGWLEHHDFYTRTGMPHGNVRTCAKRADKAVHCTDLGVTHMIDDRLDVHTHLRGIVPNLYLFGTQPAEAKPPLWVTPVPTWDHVGKAIDVSLRRAADPSTRIESFTGDHRFLSNFAPYPTVFDGIEYPTAEHAYVAAKSLDSTVRARVRQLPGPGSAKSYGRSIELRTDWLDVREQVMLEILRSKFTANPDAAQLLLDTGTAELIEGNRWHDNYWGHCTCKPCRRKGTEGSNTLGKLLMQIRHGIKSGQSGK